MLTTSRKTEGVLLWLGGRSVTSKDNLKGLHCSDLEIGIVVHLFCRVK